MISNFILDPVVDSQGLVWLPLLAQPIMSVITNLQLFTINLYNYLLPYICI